MKTWSRYIALVVLVSLLILVRVFEASLFYDPLIEYFQNSYLYTKMPQVDTWRLIKSLFFRYSLNSILSLAIIYVSFKSIKLVKFAGFFMMVAFMILILIFVYLLRFEFSDGYLFPFYIRRFLIHPIFLLLLFPAFYFQILKRNR